MTDDEYLRQVLAEQQLEEDSEELRALRERAAEVKDLLSSTFGGCKYSIRYGGSKAKRTMIRENYDLDLVFYLHNGENGAGETLEEIYFNVAAALRDSFIVEEKTCALRLHSKRDGENGDDLKVDVVPGRFTDDDKADCYLYQNGGAKERLKTNLQVHIDHVKESGVLDALGLLKLLRVRRNLSVKQFVWELLAIELLADMKDERLPDQLLHVLEEIRDNTSPPKVVDPANPTGNDFTPVLGGLWPQLRSMAQDVLAVVGQDGWEEVFGETKKKAAHVTRLIAAARDVQAPVRPWDPGKPRR